MIAVYPFSEGDQDLALKNAKWMNELGGCKGHEVLVVYDRRCNPEIIEAMGTEMRKCFNKVWRIMTEIDIDGWPQGANYMFRLAATWLQERPQYPCFLWMEPDAIPMRKGWMNDLDQAYKIGGKPFMGDRVDVRMEKPEVPVHMSGVGVYENPIYKHAGEAYRAHDIAWDVMAKDQILPQCHFTKLIQHHWKHGTFSDLSEARREAVVFHSSKDGSLIDLLQQKTTAVPLRADYRLAGSANSSGSPTCDIFIRTYPKDYPWLDYCLQSIYKFCSGFRKIWVVSTENPPPSMSLLPFRDSLNWKVVKDEAADGYLAQQITKLYADLLTDNQADYILHIDSDCIFLSPVTPDYYLRNGKPIWYYEAYPIKYRLPWIDHDMEVHWQTLTEKFMGEPVPLEFMRRIPIIMPRWLYPKLREFCHAKHGQVISEYIAAQPPRMFSEFNALGAYAYKFHQDKFEWVDCRVAPMQDVVAKQYPGWVDFGDAVKSEIERALSDVADQTQPVPKDTAMPTETLADRPPGATSPKIKHLDNDLWVLEGDQISGWVEQEGRLDHDQYLLGKILGYIKEGDCVVDIGAHIGDHTIAYVRQTGFQGVVHAFEPNPASFQCLTHNVSEALFYQTALGEEKGRAPLSGNNGQPSGGYIGEHTKVADVWVNRLDDYPDIKPNFIKIDVEGYEPKVLRGAEKTITAYRPIMVIEVNKVALERQGFAPEDIFEWLLEHGYGYAKIQPEAELTSPLFDILCLPTVSPEVTGAVSGDGASRCCAPSPPPVNPTMTATEQIRMHIDRLKHFAETSHQNKAEVMRCLVAANLKSPKKKKKHETRNQTQRDIPAGQANTVASESGAAQGAGKHPGRNTQK